jgi:hypothetical protein
MPFADLTAVAPAPAVGNVTDRANGVACRHFGVG